MSRLTLLFACATIAVAPLGAQSLKVKEEKAGMLKQAKVTAEAALATAQAKVPGGTLKSAEIEKEDGKLSYAFSFTTKGKTGEDEVLVDAMTGAVLHAMNTRLDPAIVAFMLDHAEQCAVRLHRCQISRIKLHRAMIGQPGTSSKCIRPGLSQHIASAINRHAARINQ